MPKENLLGERGQGFHQFLEILDGGRISVAAMGVGLAQGAYDLARTYAQERRQFGRPIAEFQAVQFKLADMAVEIDAGRLLTYKAAWLKDRDRPFAQEAAIAKLYTGELSNRAVNARPPDPRRLRLHGRVRHLSALSRPEDPRDRRGHERGPADGHRTSFGPDGKQALASGAGSLAFVVLRQFVDDDLGCASYLIGDAGLGRGCTRRSRLCDRAVPRGGRFRRVANHPVLETHTHADHVSGHGRLALEHGIPISVHVDAGAAFPNDPLEDGDEITIGSTVVRTLHTPGHRPEHCCFLAGDALLTGDSLFIGAAARPDLAVEEREGAEGLYHSLHRLLDLRDDVRVLPGHVAGSLCGVGMSAERASTIGQERRFNPALALATVEEFVAESTSVATPRPPNMEQIVEFNRGPFVGAVPAIGPTAQNGHFVLDVRDAEQHAKAHVHGAINVPVAGSSFGTRAGFLVPARAVIALHASDPEQAALAAAKLHAVGFFELAGYLHHPEASETLAPIELAELQQLVASTVVEVIDVREPYERDAGYIPGSRNIPYRVLGEFADDLPRRPAIVTICESGARAGIAASVLAAAGVHARPVLHGGIDDWLGRGWQLVEFRRCGT